MLWKSVIIVLLVVNLTACARLETSNDDVVIEAIRENKNLVILFCELRIFAGDNFKKSNQITFS